MEQFTVDTISAGGALGVLFVLCLLAIGGVLGTPAHRGRYAN